MGCGRLGPLLGRQASGWAGRRAGKKAGGQAGGQAGGTISRNPPHSLVPARPCLPLPAPACPCLPLPAPACPCLSLPAPACPCLPLPAPSTLQLPTPRVAQGTQRAQEPALRKAGRRRGMPRTCDEAAQHATQLALSRHRDGVSTTPANVWPPFQLFAQRQGPVCRQPARATGWATRTQPGAAAGSWLTAALRRRRHRRPAPACLQSQPSLRAAAKTSDHLHKLQRRLSPALMTLMPKRCTCSGHTRQAPATCGHPNPNRQTQQQQVRAHCTSPLTASALQLHRVPNAGIAGWASAKIGTAALQYQHMAVLGLQSWQSLQECPCSQLATSSQQAYYLA